VRTTTPVVVSVEEWDFAMQELKVQGWLSGKWIDYVVGKQKFSLHETLGLEVATHLSIWEELNDTSQITRNENGLIIGIVTKEK